jgi:hypothetical protein
VSASDIVLPEMLRGGSPPAASLLEAIERINPNFRVSFTPEIARQGKLVRPALWWIHLQNDGRSEADRLRRQAGLARLKRLWERPRKELEQRISSWWDTEYLVHGLYFVAHYEIWQWGEEAMLQQLRQGEAMYQDELKKARRAATQDDLAAAETEHEMYDNPEFAGFVRDVATDFYRSVSGGVQVSVSKTLTKEQTDDVTDGESLGRPGHGEGCEPGQHSVGSGGEHAQAEVRAAGDGAGRAADGSESPSAP